MILGPAVYREVHLIPYFRNISIINNIEKEANKKYLNFEKNNFSSSDISFSGCFNIERKLNQFGGGGQITLKFWLVCKNL